MASAITLSKATGTATFTKNVLANDTILIGNVTYKWVASPGTANDVDLGSDLETSLDNLTLAINGTGTPGATTYFAGTSSAPAVIATNSSTVLTLTARLGGTHGNNIHLAEGTDSGSAYSITRAMSGGAGAQHSWMEGIISDNQINAEVYNELRAALDAAAGA